MNQAAEHRPVYGKNAVAELLKSGAAVDTVLLSDTLNEGVASYLTALAKQAGAVVKRSKTEKLDALSEGARHQGVAAFAAQIFYRQLSDLLEVARQSGQAPFLLLCDGVEDPRNLGALLRSALLCGAHGAVITRRGSPGVTPVVMKTSAGAAAHLPVARVANLGEAIRWLKRQNLFVYCADMDGPPLESQNLGGALALVLGGEGRGVSPLVKKLCDGCVSLRMVDTAGPGSFNVSAAGSIIMYSIATQRCAQH